MIRTILRLYLLLVVKDVKHYLMRFLLCDFRLHFPRTSVVMLLRCWQRQQLQQQLLDPLLLLPITSFSCCHWQRRTRILVPFRFFESNQGHYVLTVATELTTVEMAVSSTKVAMVLAVVVKILVIRLCYSSLLLQVVVLTSNVCVS